MDLLDCHQYNVIDDGRAFAWNTLALPIAVLVLATAVSRVRMVTAKRA